MNGDDDDHKISDLLVPTTPAAVVGEVLRPVIAADSIYRCARVLNIFCFLGIWWHFKSLLLKVPPKLRSELITRDYDDCKISDMFDVV